MPKIAYIKKRLGPDAIAIIQRANQILEEYGRQGFNLTLRQLYYQFVAHDYFPEDRKWRWAGSKWMRDPNGTKNAEPNYKWLGDIVNDGRMCGWIDWNHITDRTRNLKENSHWNSPAEIIETCSRQFLIDKWRNQGNYVEVWVEKDALIGILESVCRPLDVPYFSCRGYTSQSEMWGASQRLLKQIRAGKKVTVIHLGDHDPSGVDMSRDIEDRIEDFLRLHLMQDFMERQPEPEWQKKADHDWADAVVERWTKERVGPEYFYTLKRIALTMEQIEEYNPPPNPAKLTDARAKKYVEQFGDESWELDALEPGTITALIRDEVLMLVDDAQWKRDQQVETRQRENLGRCAKLWRAPSVRVGAGALADEVKFEKLLRTLKPND